MLVIGYSESRVRNSSTKINHTIISRTTARAGVENILHGHI